MKKNIIIKYLAIICVIFKFFTVTSYAENKTIRNIGAEELTEQLILYENYENDSFTREDCIVNIMKIIGLNEKKIDKNGIIMGIENNFLDYKERGLHIYDYDYIEYALRIGMIQLETDIRGRGYYLRPYDKAAIGEVLTLCIRCLEKSENKCEYSYRKYIFTEQELWQKSMEYGLIDGINLSDKYTFYSPINVEIYKNIISNLLNCEMNLHFIDSESYPVEAKCDKENIGKTYKEYIINNGGFEARKKDLYLCINGNKYSNPVFPYYLENNKIIISYFGLKNCFLYDMSKTEFSKIVEKYDIERYEKYFGNDIDNTYVSIREFCEAIGYKVDYEESSNTIILTN